MAEEKFAIYARGPTKMLNFKCITRYRTRTEDAPLRRTYALVKRVSRSKRRYKFPIKTDSRQYLWY